MDKYTFVSLAIALLIVVVFFLVLPKVGTSKTQNNNNSVYSNNNLRTATTSTGCPEVQSAVCRHVYNNSGYPWYLEIDVYQGSMCIDAMPGSPLSSTTHAPHTKSQSQTQPQTQQQSRPRPRPQPQPQENDCDPSSCYCVTAGQSLQFELPPYSTTRLIYQSTSTTNSDQWSGNFAIIDKNGCCLTYHYDDGGCSPGTSDAHISHSGSTPDPVFLNSPACGDITINNSTWEPGAAFCNCAQGQGMCYPTQDGVSCH